MHSTALATGKLRGTIYDFDLPGDELTKHTHDEATVHITVVARGSFDAYGDGWQQILSTGDVVDWMPNDPHGFIAREPNSKMVNIIKGTDEPH